MLNTLTQQQIWGLQYLMQVHNDSATTANASSEAFNVGLPEEHQRAIVPVFATLEQFAAARLAALADSGYAQLVAYKEQTALELFRGKSPEEQAAILQQLQVPDVFS